MTFYNTYDEYRHYPDLETVSGVTGVQVEQVLRKSVLSPGDFFTLLSPAAEPYLELIAQKASLLTRNQFGRAILLYTPMYLSNYCINYCLYCGFNARNDIGRKQLSTEEVKTEAARIAETGLKHILILTGEAPTIATVDYLKSCCTILSDYFTSIAIEIYPMSTSDYRELIGTGVDSMTLYQETYNEDLYEKLHVKGPKKDYRFRLDAPERACAAGMRSVNIGALLGLDDWRREAFYTGLHAYYLQSQYPEVEISVSFPRMRPHAGEFNPDYPVDDRSLVQIILATRLFMPRAGITISTREKAEFRNNLLPLGVTKMSAGSSTVVGGHTSSENETGQFDISDERSVVQMAESLRNLGYQPVYKDWQPI